MILPEREVAEWRGVDAARFRDEIVPLGRPAVLRGLVGEWPAVARGAASPRAMADYLAAFDRGAPVEGFIAPPEAGGRFFYSDDLSGFNFERRKGRVRDIAAHLAGQAPGASAPAIYVGSAPIPDCLPGFERENALALLGGRDVVPRIWIGNATLVAPHFDLSDNIACVVAGRRRFLLFPPEQAANLYVGPLDHTMAGQPASMVDVRTPDLDRHPRYREALAAGETAALEPGDALYIPSPWWHGVEAAGPLNVLVNYWWDDAPPGAGSPFEAMVHGIYAFAGQSEARRAAWRAMYDHFVFRRDGDPAAHLPGDRRGILGAPTPQLHERIRAFLLTMLGRR